MGYLLKFAHTNAIFQQVHRLDTKSVENPPE